MDIKKQILDALNSRHACRDFDVNKDIPKEEFMVILESARLSPSSSGFEPWKLIILDNKEIRGKIKPFCAGAQTQLDTSNHFIVILARRGQDMRHDSDYIKETMRDLQKNSPEVVLTRIEGLKQFQQVNFDLNEENSLFEWACRQTYIVLANVMTSAALLGIDSCAIEGFDKGKVEDILTKEKIFDKDHFGIACMVAFGYRKIEPKKGKTRREMIEIIKWVE